jgi:hypothetical protein
MVIACYKGGHWLDYPIRNFSFRVRCTAPHDLTNEDRISYISDASNESS